MLWDKRRSITTTLVVGFCGAVLCALVVIIIWTKSLIGAWETLVALSPLLIVLHFKDIKVDTSQLRSPVLVLDHLVSTPDSSVCAET